MRGARLAASARQSLGALLALSLVMSSCTPQPPPLAALYAGCEQILVGPRCELSVAARLRFYIEHAPALTATIAVDGVPVAAARDAVGRGFRYSAEVRPDAREVSVSVAGQSLRLPITRRSPHPLVAHAMVLRRHDPEAALRLLTQHHESLAGRERAASLSLLGRLAWGRGDAPLALRWLEASRTAHAQADCVSCAVQDALVAAYVAIHGSRDFGRAAMYLEEARSQAAGTSEGVIDLPYYEGLLAAERGDYRHAIDAFRRSALAAQKLGAPHLERAAIQTQALALTAVGDYENARLLLLGMVAALDPAIANCERAALLNNVGWLALAAREAATTTGLDDAEVTESLRQAWELYAAQGACPQPAEAANVAVNLALDALQRQDTVAAAAYLAQSRRLSPAPRLRLWQLDIEARLAMAAGRAQQARRLLTELAELAARLADYEGRWRAAYGMARLALSDGHAAAALSAFETSEQVLGDALSFIAAGEGRSTFLGAHTTATHMYLELLLREGLTARALLVARRARARALASVVRADLLSHLPPDEQRRWDAALAAYRAQRDKLEENARTSWELSVEEWRRAAAATELARGELHRLLDATLPFASWEAPAAAPAPGELLLVIYELGSDWIVFAEDADATAYARQPRLPADSDPAALARAILAPHAAAIARAARLRVITAGSANAIDVHALPFASAPLVARLPVVYALDLMPARPRGCAAQQGALIVGDPLGNLPAARREAQQAASALGASTLLIGEQATRSAVQEAMGRHRVLYVAGHASFAGWQSTLPLAGLTELTVGDILVMRCAPEIVVLAGCETGLAERVGTVEGMGLAQAFTAAGARSVVATSRKVEDTATARLLGRLYAQARGGESSLAEALAAAQRIEVTLGGTMDWAAFRAYEP